MTMTLYTKTNTKTDSNDNGYITCIQERFLGKNKSRGELVGQSVRSESLVIFVQTYNVNVCTCVVRRVGTNCVDCCICAHLGRAG